MARRGNPYARSDARTRQAKARGYPARSIFKLKEIDRRMKLLSRGMSVLDLGAAPGSWAMYAAQCVGEQGRVLAIDLKPMEREFPANVRLAQGNALKLDNVVLAEFAPYDLVMSDMAPNTSGSKVRDQARSFDLFMRALEVASALGREGSHFTAKIFMSTDFQEARQAVRDRYELVKTIRPNSTRQTSSEVFVVGMRQRPGVTAELTAAVDDEDEDEAEADGAAGSSA